MKKIFMLSALFSATLFSFTSCVEEGLETPTPANDGDEIVFGARAGFENAGGADTKTVYTGVYYTVGEGSAQKKFERIDWIDGTDMIQIFCPEAEGPNPSHYTVNHSKDHDTQKDYAYLTKNEVVSLRWKGDGVHNFYAMYPSSDMFSTDQTTLAQGVTMNGAVMKGIVPGTQTPVSITANGDDWVAAPDMKYAYMAAKGTATREQGSVSLSFVPVVTAVQIQFTLAETSADPVTIAEVRVQGEGIAGDFTADLADWDGTYPACVNDGAGTGLVQVPMWVDANPITIQPGGSLTFTVFLRPGTQYQNLKISYSPTGSGYITKTMGSESQPVVIPQNLKTVVKGFKLPATAITYDASNWMTQISDALEFKKLSIPGTGGSFSYAYTGSDADLFRSQYTDMDIPAQWKAGIRAFEIVSDRHSDTSLSLGTTQVTCNKNDVGITVADAMNAINKQLSANPQECAVVIFTYQPEGNSPARNATGYANNLKNWYEGIDYKDKFIKYTPSLTMGNARGKILVLVRLNQRDEDESGSFSGAVSALSGCPFVLIDGCGTAKDKWGARGYTITQSNGTTITAPDISNDASVYVEQYMSSATINPETHANVRRGAMNFNYKTEDTNVECWYQEWARVLPSNIYNASGSMGFFNGGSYQAMYWFESYEEKLENAVETFKMAISDGYPTYLFVNTLSGYMATEATKGSPTYSLVPSVGSVYGGAGGDIAALATKLNADFYQEVLGAGMEQTTGPTGVVIMDYVNNEPTEGVQYDGAYLLPGVIISNNFKYASGNGNNNPGGGEGGSGNGDSGNTDDEGDAW